MTRSRLLIFVIAYQADSTLTWVLDRIPRTVHEDFETEILVVDDASVDRTFEIGSEYRAAHPELRITVLRNRYNQGYGGNQKVGYQYAIRHGFDFVAMIHGDGQYAPEELPRLLTPLVHGEADAVFGSRMIVPGAARKGGMPMYKYVGNRVLTTIQNRILGTRFSEFHSGYRIYAVSALRRIRFTLNSNQFHFDTEVILQLLNAGQRIVEVPIPTYYGDEISRVNGIPYAWNVVLATVKNWFHRRGLLHRRRFDPLEAVGEENVKLGYPSSHEWALAAVPRGANVLVMGEQERAMAALLRKQGCTVTAVVVEDVEEMPPEVSRVVQPLHAMPVFDTSEHDYLLLLDVIEHLPRPEEFLDDLRAGFDYRPRVLLLTTPNVGFVIPRLMLALGQFNYGTAGILDRTHTRLFTFASIRRLLRDAGFRITEVRGIPAPFPKALGDTWLSRALLRLNEMLIRLNRRLFAYQIAVAAESTPPIDFLLDDARAHSQP